MIINVYNISAALVERAPVIVEGPQSTYVEIYSYVSLTCISNGNPQPVIQWYKNGEPLSGENTAVFIIKQLNLNTRGKYHCTATNKLGQQMSEEVYVKIKGTVVYDIDTT